MAISRHDPEWQRTIAEAALAGVTFELVHGAIHRKDGGNGRLVSLWHAILPNRRIMQAHSKIAVARLAIQVLRGEFDGT